MNKTCDTCTAENLPIEIPFVAHEKEVCRLERHIKRLWIALIVAIALIFASNMVWLWYESQFETISYSQDGEGTNIVGNENEVNNGAEGEAETEEGQEQG